MKRFILVLFIIPVFYPSFAQSSINNKITVNIELLNMLAVNDLLFEDVFNQALTPIELDVNSFFNPVYLRLRPNARIGYTLGPRTELFVQAGFYNTRVRYSLSSSITGSVRIAHGTTFTAGTGIRFYRRKKSALAPLGKYFQLALNLHQGNNNTEEGDPLSSQTAMEFRIGLGKQYPLTEFLLMDVGVGFGGTAGLGMTFSDQEIPFLEENTFESYLIGNSFFLRIGLGIMR